MKKLINGVCGAENVEKKPVRNRLNISSKKISSFSAQSGSGACTRLSREIDSVPVGFFGRAAFQNGCDERGGESVASAYGIYYFNFLCRQCRNAMPVAHLASLFAVGDDEVAQIVAVENLLGGKPKHIGDDGLLFVVDFQNVASAERFLYYVTRVKCLPQVGIEHL